MLSFLRIRNLAVIAAADVEFEAGFNVLTGETGAGKSILVEAVGLLLGARASADLVRTGETLASIEAVFNDRGQELIVRREISASGRSRSFVNGALATAGALRELSNRLVELHGQHEHQALLDPASHLSLLDAFAGAGTLVEEVGRAWARVLELREQLDRVGMEAGEREARLDLVTFQLGELERAAPTPGEDEEMAVQKTVLASAERLERLCNEGYALLYDSDGAALAALGATRKRLVELSTLDARFEPYVAAAQSVQSQVEDIAWFLRDYAGRIESSPRRLQEVEDRLALLERLKRKYGPTLADVISRRDTLTRERELLSGSSDRADEVRTALEGATARFLAPAERLSILRREAASRFGAALIEMLGHVAMPRTRFEVRFNTRPLPPESWSAAGIDDAEFFISPNPGEELRPLARIASGGELSRIMLAIKTLAAHGAEGRSTEGATRTLIFDEVDAGISGQVASVVGASLASLGRDFQVLCITHLPQIAARGTTHVRISKAVVGDRTVTTVTRLGPNDRIQEIARMIGGDAATAAVRTSAQEMLADMSDVADVGTTPQVRSDDDARSLSSGAKGESERRKRKS